MPISLISQIQWTNSKKHKMPQEGIDNLNRPIISKVIELIIKHLSAKKSSNQYRFTGEFFQTFEE